MTNRGKQPAKRRTRIPISGWLVPGEDEPKLIERWTAVPRGQKGAVLREALLKYFSIPLEEQMEPIARVRLELELLRDLVAHLPTEVAAKIETLSAALPSTSIMKQADAQPQLSTEAMQLMSKQILKRPWRARSGK